jgi:hypothetical protein
MVLSLSPLFLFQKRPRVKINGVRGCLNVLFSV